MKDNRVSNKKLLIAQNVEKYVDEYDICQQIKNKIETLAEKLIMNE